MLAVSIVVVALALVGHAALWVGVVNRWHATGYPRRIVKSVTLLFYLALVTIPFAVAIYLMAPETSFSLAADRLRRLDWATAYIAFCAAYGAAHLPVWAIGRLRGRELPAGVRLVGERVVDMVQQLGASPARGPRTQVLSRVPFNQIWKLHVRQFDLEVPRLPPSLDGLSICHLSDLHYSGRIDRAYYDEVMRQTNALEVDLILLTGDVCDHERYIDWIPDTLGRLQARLGKFFILGNHDLRTRAIGRLRGTLDEAGFADVAGRHRAIADDRVIVAGDERPWFRSSVPDVGDLPPETFKILLAHTPDQLKWARAGGFDLMFAGHTHGGQLHFPLVGPVVCPSWHGTRYSAGFFHEPPTVLHVSRGAAGLFPYRLNCPPEITRIKLHATA